MLKFSRGFIILPSPKPPLLDGFWKKPPEVYAFVMLPRWRWNTSTFQAWWPFFSGDTHLPSGWGGWSLWKCCFFKRIWRKNYPPKKMCPKNGTPVQKELSGDMFVFQGRKNFYHFTSSPKKTKKTLGNNQWLNHKGRTNTKFHFPLVNTKVYGFHILWLGEVGR